MNKLNLLAIFLWLAIGLYGIFFNLTYIDEAKYLIKGWLMTSGQIGYYSTPEFFYQHMPGGLLWYGLGQKLFGPNLLIARIQSFLVGLVILFFTYRLAELIKPKAGRLILPILALSPVAILYYSSAVPQSLAALTLVLAFYFWFKNKQALTTIFFTLAFIVRENFLFTLIFYLLYQRRIRLWLISLTVIIVFLAPGWPGTINILKNFPGVSRLLPVSAAEQNVLGLNFQQQAHSFNLYWQAVKQFIEIYSPLLLVFLLSLKLRIFRDRRFYFLLFTAGFNFLAHAWSAFNLSPRSIVPYFSYIFPLTAVIAAVQIKSIKKSRLALLMLLAPLTLFFSSLFQPPAKPSTISLVYQSAANLKPLIADKPRIVWLTEPMTLYLAGRVSYWPLVNYTNFYKPSDDTVTVRKLGFWNRAIMNQWLNEADLVVVDKHRTGFINLKPNCWQILPAPAGVWPEGLSFYLPKSRSATLPEPSPGE